MKNSRLKLNLLVIFALCFLACSILACDKIQENTNTDKVAPEENTAAFKQVLTKHLNAVTNKDTTALRATLSPKGNMELIQPKAEILYTADAFMEFHKNWFKSPNWTFETKIESIVVGKNLGVATTEIIYREPERDGKPYYNRMNVSYTLEKIEGNWYITKDHASSIERSTDTQ